MVAVSHGNVQCLQLLLNKGAEVNQHNEVSSFHDEMSSLSFEWSISSKVSLIKRKAHNFVITIIPKCLFFVFVFQTYDKSLC